MIWCGEKGEGEKRYVKNKTGNEREEKKREREKEKESE